MAKILCQVIFILISLWGYLNQYLFSSFFFGALCNTLQLSIIYSIIQMITLYIPRTATSTRSSPYLPNYGPRFSCHSPSRVSRRSCQVPGRWRVRSLRGPGCRWWSTEIAPRSAVRWPFGGWGCGLVCEGRGSVWLPSVGLGRTVAGHWLVSSYSV